MAIPDADAGSSGVVMAQVHTCAAIVPQRVKLGRSKGVFYKLLATDLE